MIPDLHYIELAHRLNTEHHARLMKMQAHFRGNRKSFSLISLRKESPELGQRRIKKEDKALEWLEQWEQIPPVQPKRPTPEKELQAWSILNALQNNGALPFDRNLRFLTSELVMHNGTKKCINDILAMDADGGLVVIELKSTRNKREIEGQVKAFMDIIIEDQDFFSGLSLLLVGREWNLKVSGMVVWNACSVPRRAIRSGIREFCYTDEKRGKERSIAYAPDGSIHFNELT